MAREKYLPEDIIQYLRTFKIEQSKGFKIDEVAEKVGISYQTLCRWKKEFGGLRVDQAKKELSFSERRICKVISWQRSSFRYQPVNNEFQDRLKAKVVNLASEYGRYGYRQVAGLLTMAPASVNGQNLKIMFGLMILFQNKRTTEEKLKY